MVVMFVVIFTGFCCRDRVGDEGVGDIDVGIECPSSILVFEGADVVEEKPEPEPETEGIEVALLLERAIIVDVTVP
jgi:hypothetical protein